MSLRSADLHVATKKSMKSDFVLDHMWGSQSHADSKSAGKPPHPPPSPPLSAFALLVLDTQQENVSLHYFASDYIHFF